MRKTVIFALITLLFATAITMAFDSKGLAQALNLSEDQTTRIENIAKTSAEQLEKIRADVKTAETELKAAIEKDASFNDAVSAVNKLNSLETEYKSIQAQMLLSIRDELNNDQKKEYTKFLVASLAKTCCSVASTSGSGCSHYHESKDASKAAPAGRSTGCRPGCSHHH